MITPTGNELFQIPACDTVNFDELWFQAENPFAQFSPEEQLIGKKRKINQLKENQKKYQKTIDEYKDQNYSIIQHYYDCSKQLTGAREQVKELSGANNKLQSTVEQLTIVNNQLNLVVEENNQLKEINDELIAENSRLASELEKATKEKEKAISLLDLVNDEHEELQEEHNNLVQFLKDNRDARHKNEFVLKKGTPVIELLD